MSAPRRPTEASAAAPAVSDVDELLAALEAALDGGAPVLRSGQPTGAGPTARQALDRLAAICLGCAERLRAWRDADADPLRAARTTRHAWLWHVTGLRLRDVGPRRARAAVLRQLERRAAEDAVIAPACTRAAELIEAVLTAVEDEAARSTSRCTTSAAAGRARSPRITEAMREKYLACSTQTGRCADTRRGYAAPVTGASPGEIATPTLPSPQPSNDL